jgi:hypothetical protein
MHACACTPAHAALSELLELCRWHEPSLLAATGALAGISVEKEAKLPVAQGAGQRLARLLMVSRQRTCREKACKRDRGRHSSLWCVKCCQGPPASQPLAGVGSSHKNVQFAR